MNKTIIIILGGGLTRDKDGKWRTTNFNEKGDSFGAVGDRLRVIAGSCLRKNNPNSLIIASGGKGQYENKIDTPNISEIIKNELIELDIPAKNIILETNSGNTYQQLKEIQKIITKLDSQQAIIISNKYHLPRIRAMIKYNKNLKNLSMILLQSAEEILIKHKPKQWRAIIESAYKSGAMKKRIALEVRGVKQIKEGIYNYE